MTKTYRHHRTFERVEKGDLKLDDIVLYEGCLGLIEKLHGDDDTKEEYIGALYFVPDGDSPFVFVDEMTGRIERDITDTFECLRGFTFEVEGMSELICIVALDIVNARLLLAKYIEELFPVFMDSPFTLYEMWGYDDERVMT